MGRFSPEQGGHLLVEAFEQIDIDVKRVMAGAASYCDHYSRELRTHAIDRIHMLDWISGEALDELLTSDVPENREVVDGAGFTFQRGNAGDLADRLRFLIANPAVREAAGRTAKNSIKEQYQWQKVAEDIEKAYFTMLGPELASEPIKKPSVLPAAVRVGKSTERRAG